MMLLSDREYIRLIAEGLTDLVLPMLSDPTARDAVNIGIDGLLELIRRADLLPQLAASLAPAGIALAHRAEVLVRRVAPGEAIRPVSELPDVASRSGFEGLMAWLDDASKTLLRADPDVGTAERETIGNLLRAIADWELDYYSRFYGAPKSQVSEITGAGQLTAAKLAGHIQARVPGHETAEILAFEMNPGGYTNSTFFFTLRSAGRADERLVARKRSPNPWFDFWAFRAEDEFEIVSRLFAAGLPVARPLWLFRNMPDIDADYYVMERGQGRPVGSLHDAYAGGKTLSETILLNLASFLARLHSLPIESFADYLASGDTPVRIGDTASDATRKNIDHMRQFWFAARRGPSPSEAFMIDWLSRNVPENASPPVLVHGDCFVHNILRDADDNITMVADWESAHFGDPAEDLAYIVDQVSQQMDWDRFMARYHAAGGPAISADSLNYFKASLNFRNSIGANVGVLRVRDGYRDIRMIPLGGDFFTAFMRQGVQATAVRA